MVPRWAGGLLCCSLCSPIQNPNRTIDDAAMTNMPLRTGATSPCARLQRGHASAATDAHHTRIQAPQVHHLNASQAWQTAHLGLGTWQQASGMHAGPAITTRRLQVAAAGAKLCMPVAPRSRLAMPVVLRGLLAVHYSLHASLPICILRAFI